MAFKVVAALAVLACAQAQLYGGAYSRPLARLAYQAPYAPALRGADDEYDPNPQYDFNYSVNDALTGDSKSQQESRQGDSVRGSYSLLEADGSRRVVEYTADPVNGFNAVVHRDGGAARIAAPVPIARAAPILAPRPALAYAPRPAYRAAASPAFISSSFSSPYATYGL